MKITLLLHKLIHLTEFTYIYCLGKVLGISWVIQYLRNPNPRLTNSILRSFGAKVGSSTTFKRSVFIDNVFEDQNSAGDFRYLRIGDNCYLGDCLYLDLANKIVLENNVVISGKVSLLTHSDCNRSTILAHQFPRKCDPIIIKEGAWIGFGAILLSGVTIGKNAVVAASSLVRTDISENTVNGGIPAVVIRKLGCKPNDTGCIT